MGQTATDMLRWVANKGPPLFLVYPRGSSEGGKHWCDPFTALRSYQVILGHPLSEAFKKCDLMSVSIGPIGATQST